MTQVLAVNWKFFTENFVKHITCTQIKLSSATSRRAQYKHNIVSLVYHLLSGMAAAYPATDCQLLSKEGRCQLRSADSRTCVIRQTYSNFVDWCFTAAGPKLWNSLPAGLRQTDIGYVQFKWLRKTSFILVLRSWCTVTICLNSASQNFPTYLQIWVHYTFTRRISPANN